ncbi:hypothetical protein GE253_13565 [Niveispirillum sp. SYP-B3756]|uniref:hypothetical protein n=1 Tax=Niveispirillum sp. SYP-B3756 TaxID=2662178 RepID=UPI00129099A1|nr:hypothetical protein [Niveispirillum sp. SYP-B3756]MQP66367.1 hypothetical protein [Niveispirillum sp. SYP-B3756]
MDRRRARPQKMGSKMRRHVPSWPFTLTSGGGRPAHPTGSANMASSSPGGTPAYNGRFRPLFTVLISHSYYDGDDDRCRDFRIQPTPTSLDLMQSLGLVFRDWGTGFSVFVDEARLDGLVNYLRRQSSSGGLWSWLSFIMVPTNTAFVGITAMPLGIAPIRLNFYMSNQEARQTTDRDAILSEGPLSADIFYPPTGTFLTVPIQPDTRQIWAINIAGDTAIQQDIPKLDQDLTQYQLDFSTVPMGLYWIYLFNGNDLTPLWPLLYTDTGKVPLGFIDLILTRPTPTTPGVYPVPPVDEGPVSSADIGHLTYLLRFEARSTRWRYYVASQAPGTLHDVIIHGQGTEFSQQSRVILPTGQPALLFEAADELPLRQQSAQRFRLRGVRRGPDGRENAVRVECLPVAPGTPVRPGVSEQSGTSEMYIYV